MSKDLKVPAGRALIVGLGNPGRKYDGTRHNIGFAVADLFAARWNIRLNESRFDSEMGSGPLRDHTAVILKPQTFMNLSGKSVGPAARFWKLGPESVIVIHDDIDLPLGKVRVKVGGGHGGHNGLRDIDPQLGKNYFRLRVGVGRPEHGNVSGWVLGKFATSEQGLVDQVLDLSCDAIEWILSEGLLEAQGKLHPVSLS